MVGEMRSTGARAVLLAGLLAAGRAHAGDPAPRTPSLGWVRLAGAETCAAPRAVAEAVEKRLGRAVFVAPTRADVAVEGRVERAGPSGGWRATITLSDERGAVLGTRELTSDAADCAALDAPITLALALMIDPDAALGPPPAPAPAPPAPPPLPPPPPLPAAIAPAPRCDPAPAAPAAPPVRWRAGAQIGFAGSLGLLPHPAPGVTLRLHVVPPRGPAFEIGASAWLEGHVDAVNVGGAGAAFDLSYGSLAVCPLALAVGRTTFFACAGAQIGSLRAQGVGFDTAYAQQQLVLDLAAEAHVRRALLGPFFAAVELGLLVPTVRDLFAYRDAAGTTQELFRLPPLAGTAEVALGLAFP
jgi:hypothetical protein